MRRGMGIVAMLTIAGSAALTACGSHTYAAMWDAKAISQDGMTLSIVAIGSPCDVGRPHTHVAETKRTVSIKVRLSSKSDACSKVGVPRPVDVHLQSPLDG